MKGNSAPTSKSTAPNPEQEFWPGFKQVGAGEYEIKSAYRNVRLVLYVGEFDVAQRIHDAIRQAELLAFQEGRLSILRHRKEEEND